MPRQQARESEVYRAVKVGDLQIDIAGRVWRVRKRGWDRWLGVAVSRPCRRVRAEHNTGGYRMVRAMIDGIRHGTQASRLVWLHFNGPIPSDLTINHKDGHKKNNRPKNLELATDTEQALHAIYTLGKNKRMLRQRGAANAMAKLNAAKVRSIRRARYRGVPLLVLSKQHNVSCQAISKVARGERWAHLT